MPDPEPVAAAEEPNWTRATMGEPPPPETAESADLKPLEMINAAIEQWLTAPADTDFDDTIEIHNMRDDATPKEWAVIRFAAIERGLWLGELGNRWPLLLGRAHVTGWLRDPRMAKMCGLKRPWSSAVYADRTVGFIIGTLTDWGALVRLPEPVRCNGWPMWAYELGVDSGARRAEHAGARAHQPHDTGRDFEFVRGAEFDGLGDDFAASVGAADVDGGFHAGR